MLKVIALFLIPTVGYASGFESCERESLYNVVKKLEADIEKTDVEIKGLLTKVVKKRASIDENGLDRVNGRINADISNLENKINQLRTNQADMVSNRDVFLKLSTYLQANKFLPHRMLDDSYQVQVDESLDLTIRERKPNGTYRVKKSDVLWCARDGKLFAKQVKFDGPFSTDLRVTVDKNYVMISLPEGANYGAQANFMQRFGPGVFFPVPSGSGVNGSSSGTSAGSEATQ